MTERLKNYGVHNLIFIVTIENLFKDDFINLYGINLYWKLHLRIISVTANE
jgi:hypothetical protein